jgi:hypothetical protein
MSPHRVLGLVSGIFAIHIVMAACDGGGRSATRDDDGGTSSSSNSATSTGVGGSMTVPGGPEVMLVAAPDSMTEGGSVTFTATVIDDDGLDDIVGGMLTDEGGTTVYAPFTQLSAGTFSVSLSWSQLNAFEPINFQNEMVKVFRAEFTDTTQKAGSANVAVTLTCNLGTAIDGVCATCALPVAAPVDCASACQLFYDCGLLVCDGAQNCPGFTGGSVEENQIVGDCTIDCGALPPFGLLDPTDCAATIEEIMAASEGLSGICEFGLGD